MPRITREFVKVEVRLLYDYRFITLAPLDQLLYLKLIMLAKVTNNKIPKDNTKIESVLRLKRPSSDLQVRINNLKIMFPKFKSNKHFHYFEGFTDRLRNGSHVSSTYYGVDKDKDKDKDVRGTRCVHPLKEKRKQWAKENKFAGTEKGGGA